MKASKQLGGSLSWGGDGIHCYYHMDDPRVNFARIGPNGGMVIWSSHQENPFHGYEF